MTKKHLLASALLFAILIPPIASAEIHAVGSGTVFPFSAKVAEVYASQSGQKTPRVEGIGTGAGFKIYCNPSKNSYPNVVNASRPIKSGENALCKKNNRGRLVDFAFGYDGMTIGVNKKNKLNNISLSHLYLAMAKKVPRQSRQRIYQ